MMKPEDILREAAATIEQRAQLRDMPGGERSMRRAVEAYTALRGSEMTGELDGWIFMICVKLARATAGKPHLDDLVDLAGYAALAAECISEKPKGEVGGIDKNNMPYWKNWVDESRHSPECASMMPAHGYPFACKCGASDAKG